MTGHFAATGAVYDVKAQHHDVPDIGRHMHLSPLAPETVARQQSMLQLWESQRIEFRNRLYWPEDMLTCWKVAKLRALVDWAFETSPFYREHYREAGYESGAIRSLTDFVSLPCITKDDVIAGFPHGLPSERVDITACRWMSSSGSSGKPVQIVLPQERADLDTLFKYRMFEFGGGVTLEPDRWIYNVHYVLWWHTSLLGSYRVFSVTPECDPHAVLSHLEHLRPLVLSCTGSYLRHLADTNARLHEMGIRIVNTNSEPTTHLERRRWSNVFGVPVCDEYSSEELDLLAMECPYGQYHLVEDDTHVEVVDVDTSGLGEVVGTDLWNQAMPMIRYRQGDLARLAPGTECTCGSHFRRLEAFEGRADHAFVRRDGEPVTAGCLLDAVERYLCSDTASIDEFRIVQLDYDRVKILWVAAEPARIAEAFDGFGGKLNELFGYAVTLESERVCTIPTDSAYKRRTLVNAVTGTS